MIVPNRLEEVLIAVPNELYDRALAMVATEGLLHATEPPHELSKYQLRGYRKLSAESQERRSRIEGFYKSLGLNPAVEEGLEIRVSDWDRTYAEIVEENSELDKYFAAISERVSEVSARIVELEGLRSTLEVLGGLEANITAAWSGIYIRAAVGVVDLKSASEAIEAAKKYGLLVASEQTGDQAIVAVAGPPEALRRALGDLSKAGWRQAIIPPGLPGSPKACLNAINEQLSRLTAELEAIRSESSKRLPELRRYYTKVYAISEVAKMLSYTARTHSTSFLHGYVDVKDVRRLTAVLDTCCRGSYILLRLGTRRGEREVPTKVDLPGYFRWYQAIVNMYGTPSSDELVPTIFMAVTMPIIFGLMFPDLGHGLVLLLFALFYMLPRSRDIAKVAAVLGVAGMITGFLAGEFFGPVPAGWIDLFWHRLGFAVPPLLSPIDAATSPSTSSYAITLFDLILDLSFWIGGFMLVFGNLLGIANDVFSRNYEDLLTKRLPLTLLFLAAELPFLVYFNAFKAGGIIEQGLFDLGHGGPMQAFMFYGAIASLIWLVLGEGLYSAAMGEGFRLNPYESFLSLFEGMLLAIGNTISFLRILGLSLAHAGLMVGFAVLYYVVLAGMHYSPAGWASAILIYIIGNILTAGLEGIVAFAHDLRLHFYEWFNKFYRGFGIPFTPISVPGVRFVVV